jgi:thymidylate kinase
MVPALGQAGSGVHPTAGGAVFALVGGDGAGKSTCARELLQWLSPSLRTMHAHLGNPPKSITTLAIGAILKLQKQCERLLKRGHRADGLIELLRHLCTARDRHRLYVRVQRFAAAGGIAICERYPIEQNRPLVGPAIPGLLTGRAGRAEEWLRRAEASYYDRILRPDAVCVLRLDPEVAVQRKPEEPADYVRSRGRIIWETDWSSSGAHLVDASRPLAEVVQQLKAILWSIL